MEAVGYPFIDRVPAIHGRRTLSRIPPRAAGSLTPTGYAVVMVPAETPLFKFLRFIWAKFGKGKVWDHDQVQDLVGKSLDRSVKSAGFRVLQDKRFLGRKVSASKAESA
jgi:hypothetical protein